DIDKDRSPLLSSNSPRKFASTDEIHEVTLPFKSTTLEDLLGRARITETDLITKKNNEKKELKRKQEHGDGEISEVDKSHQRRKGKASKAKARAYPMIAEEAQLIPVVVTDTNFEKDEIENIPVVNKVGDLFLEDLSSIPPERQVEF
nr:hypothetical protein [Tanacetum cinerariifolium]